MVLKDQDGSKGFFALVAGTEREKSTTFRGRFFPHAESETHYIQSVGDTAYKQNIAKRKAF